MKQATVKHTYIIFTLSVFLAFIVVSMCSAEKIYLKNGEILQERIASFGSRTIWIERKTATGAGSVGVNLEDVEKIENDDGSISRYDYRNLYKKAGDYIHQKKYGESLKLYDLLSSSFPNNIEIRYMRGILNHKLDKPDKALDNYNFLIERDAAGFEVYNNIAVIFAVRKDYVKAREFFTKAIKLNPEDSKIHNNLAELLLQNKDYGAAIEEYTRIIELEPGDVRSLYNLGILYANIDNYQKAKEQFQSALHITPEDDKIKKALEYVIYKLKEKNTCI